MTLNFPQRSISRRKSHPKGTHFSGEKRISIVCKGRPAIRTNDDDIQTLHALRVGLCLKIEQGSITFEQATDIFNRAHDMVIEKKKSDQKKGDPKL